MNEKEKFEDIIASKFSEAEFPFDEGNWDGAEEMISSFRKKEKRKRVGFIFLAGISLGVLMMLPFVIKLNDKPQNMVSEVSEISLNNNELVDNGKSKALIEQRNVQSGSTEITKGLNSDENVNNDDAQENNLTKETERAPIISSEKDELVSVKAPKNKVKNKGSELKPVSKDQNKKSKKRKSNAKQIAINSSTLTTNSVNNPNSPIIAKTPLNNTLQLNSNAVPPLASGMSESSLGSAENETKISFIPKTESSLVISNDSIPVIGLIAEPTKIVAGNKAMAILPWHVSAALGGNYVNSFSFNPIQGIVVSKSISKHFEIGSGAYYTYLTIKSGGVKSITTHTDYNFGYQSDITEIKTNKLHYAVIPVFVAYNVNDKNALVLGANTYVLFNSSNSVTTYKESYGEKQEVASKKTTGYFSGINTYDIGLFTGYKRQLFGNLGAAVYFNYGLRDIKKNDYYGENKFERNISGQFMVTYKL